MASQIEACTGALNTLFNSINNLILRAQQLQGMDEAIFIASNYLPVRPDVGHGGDKLYEYWFLFPSTITAITDTDNRSTEITVNGVGIHGLISDEGLDAPLQAANYMIQGYTQSAQDQMNTCLEFIEIGRNEYKISAKNVIGMGTVAFGDDAEVMEEVSCTYINAAINSLLPLSVVNLQYE